MKTDYKELIQKREALRIELANAESEISKLKNSIFVGKLNKAYALIKEIEESGIFTTEEEADFYLSFEDILAGIDDYIGILRGDY